jgi:hypothetical protein
LQTTLAALYKTSQPTASQQQQPAAFQPAAFQPRVLPPQPQPQQRQQPLQRIPASASAVAPKQVVNNVSQPTQAPPQSILAAAKTIKSDKASTPMYNDSPFTTTRRRQTTTKRLQFEDDDEDDDTLFPTPSRNKSTKAVEKQQQTSQSKQTSQSQQTSPSPMSNRHLSLAEYNFVYKPNGGIDKRTTAWQKLPKELQEEIRIKENEMLQNGGKSKQDKKQEKMVVEDEKEDDDVSEVTKLLDEHKTHGHTEMKATPSKPSFMGGLFSSFSGSKIAPKEEDNLLKSESKKKPAQKEAETRVEEVVSKHTTHGSTNIKQTKILNAFSAALQSPLQSQPVAPLSNADDETDELAETL